MSFPDIRSYQICVMSLSSWLAEFQRALKILHHMEESTLKLQLFWLASILLEVAIYTIKGDLSQQVILQWQASEKKDKGVRNKKDRKVWD